MVRSTVDTARGLVEAENTRAALQFLRGQAAQDRPPFEVRRAMAELYRELDNPDQAGRWGIDADDTE